MTRNELLKVAKPMMVNLEVAKTMERKSQTRRLIKIDFVLEPNDMHYVFHKPKWKVGDILWVREPVEIMFVHRHDGGVYDSCQIKYLADEEIVKYFEMSEKHIEKKWLLQCQGIPNGCLKEMARDFRIVTNVRVERLQDISDEDCLAEGCKYPTIEIFSKLYHKFGGGFGIADGYTLAWRELWNSTAPKGYKWQDNPYVFVYEFEKVEVSE